MKYTHEVIALISVKPKSLKTKQKLKNKQKNPIKKSNYHQQSQDDTQKHLLVYDH